MNDSHVSDGQLDRLADGELTAQEYRRLLAALDDEPGGWRRCALVFLESQALTQDLTAVAPAGPAFRRPADQPVAAPHRRSRLWPLALAMAGCFLLAFTIGSLAPSWWFGRSAEVAAPTTATDPDAAGPAPETSDKPFDDSRPGARLAEDTAPNQPIMTPEHNRPRREQPDNMIVIELGDGAETRRYEVPYFEMDDYESARLVSDEPLMPEGFLRTLRRSGHELRRRHQVLRIPLDDGRRVLVPMEEAEIVPVSGRGYQ